jgi:membrane associated rhomboid family serine protease
LIPYKDDNPTQIFPFFTILFIGLNIVVFMFELVTDAQSIVFSFGAVPAALLSFKTAQPVHPALTVITAMFLHGGFLHLAGNMLYLWIFGNNIEDRLGHLRFVVFYVLCGFISAYAHAITEPRSIVPMIGASGAVAGILGAYILLFPRAQVFTVIFLGFFVQVVRLPALIVIGFWAIIQVVNGIIEKGMMDQAGVAWFAHIGGFVFGVLSIKLFMPKRRKVK